MTKLHDYAASRELLVNLTLRELRGKYKRSFLGWSWSLLNPLATVVIFSVVFSFFLKIDPGPGDPSGLENFALFLVCGLLPFNYLANGINGSIGTLVGNSNLITKVYFPREVLVVSSVAAWLYTMLIEFGVVAAIFLVAGNMVLPWLPLLVGVLLVQSMLVLGMGFLFSVLNVYFRDVQHLIGILLQAWFYATPIVYPIVFVEDATSGHPWLFDLYRLNPMVRIVEIVRNLLYDLRWPALGDVLYVVVASGVILAVGLMVFMRLEGRLAEEL